MAGSERIESPPGEVRDRSGTKRRRFDRHAAAALLAWALCSAVYVYTANGVVVHESEGQPWHHYEYLARGFLNGHLYLSVQPSPQTLALPDPYDPAQNARYRIWDASLYHGRYYLYFGPTPALALMIPWELLTGSIMPQRIATAVFACSGLAALVLLIAALRGRHFPRATPVQLFWAILVVGHVTWLPVILRRPAVWELPIVTGVSFFWWALYFVWRHHESRRTPFWALLAGTSMAFATGARPTYVLAAAAVAALVAWPERKPVLVSTLLRDLVPVALPLIIGGTALLAYNYERFGSILEFGQHYQMWGDNQRRLAHFNPGFVPFNAWLYLALVPQFSPYFPFLRSVTLAQIPAGYIATEDMCGVLFALPSLALAIPACVRAFGGTGGAACRSYRRVVLAAIAGTLCAAGVLFCFAGACSRYIVELVSGWSLLAAIGYLAVHSEMPPGRRWLRMLSAAAVVWSIAATWLASFDFRSEASVSQPALYRALAHTLDFPSYWIMKHERRQFGPVELNIGLSARRTTGSAVLLAAGRVGETDQLRIERLSPGTVRLELAVNEQSYIKTPPIRVEGGRIRVVCRAPWLYPPTDHPFWDSVPNPDRRRREQSLFEIDTRHVHAGVLGTRWYDPLSFDPMVGTRKINPDACAWVESWRRVPETP